MNCCNCCGSIVADDTAFEASGGLCTDCDATRVIPAPHLDILRHALGLAADGTGAAYRNHFVTGAGSNDHDGCMTLVSNGLMTRRPGSALSGGDDVFVVTAAGKLLARRPTGAAA